MPRRLSTLTVTATITALALFGLTGRTGAPNESSSPDSAGASQPADAAGDDGQSTADACALVQSTITEATDEFENASADDPGAVVDAMTSAAEKLTASTSQITNDQVAALLPALRDMFTKTGDVMEAVAAGDLSKIEDLSSLSTQFQETSEAFQKVCAP